MRWFPVFSRYLQATGVAMMGFDSSPAFPGKWHTGSVANEVFFTSNVTSFPIRASALAKGDSTSPMGSHAEPGSEGKSGSRWFKSTSSESGLKYFVFHFLLLSFLFLRSGYSDRRNNQKQKKDRASLFGKISQKAKRHFDN